MLNNDQFYSALKFSIRYGSNISSSSNSNWHLHFIMQRAGASPSWKTHFVTQTFLGSHRGSIAISSRLGKLSAETPTTVVISRVRPSSSTGKFDKFNFILRIFAGICNFAITRTKNIDYLWVICFGDRIPYL